jgi:hypothetical protein
VHLGGVSCGWLKLFTLSLFLVSGQCFETWTELKILSITSACFLIPPPRARVRRASVEMLAVADSLCFVKKIPRNLVSQQFTTVALKHLCILEICVHGICNVFFLQ